MSKAKPAVSFLPPKAAFTLCAAIAVQGMTLRDNVQLAAMSAIYHSVQSQNNDVGIRLVESFTDGMRKASIVAYLEQHGNFRWDAEAKALVHHRNPEVAVPVDGKLSKDDTANMHALLSANPWYDAKPESEIVSIVDVNEMISKLVKRIQKAVKDGKEIKFSGSTAEIIMAVARGDEISVTIPESPEAVAAGIKANLGADAALVG